MNFKNISGSQTKFQKHFMTLKKIQKILKLVKIFRKISEIKKLWHFSLSRNNINPESKIPVIRLKTCKPIELQLAANFSHSPSLPQFQFLHSPSHYKTIINKSPHFLKQIFAITDGKTRILSIMISTSILEGHLVNLIFTLKFRKPSNKSSLISFA